MSSARSVTSAPWTRALLAIAVACGWACADSAGPSEVERPDDKPVEERPTLAALIVSEPIASSGQALGGTSARSSAGEVAYVSLPPGTLPSAVRVRIRNVTAGGSALEAIDVVGGGFDPVPVAASENDEIELVFTTAVGSVTSAYIKVPRRRPPTIVRTSPPKGRTDVPLGSRMAVVFSEPIDPRTVASVRLTTGGTTVAGQVEVTSGAAWVVEWAPAATLQPLTTYQLVITPDVRDLEGDALEATEIVTFTTGAQLTLPGQIAFASTRDGTSFVYLANGDGSTIARLASGGRPSWSPDGRRIALERGGAGRGPFPQGSTIFLVNADGSGETRLIEGMHPAWSPDGNRIAYVDADGLSVINLDGSGLTKLIRHDATLDSRVGFYVGSPAWSPDGTRIAFEQGTDGLPQRIYLMNADGTQPRPLSQWTTSGFSAECSPAWSPDGTKVVFWDFFLGIGTIGTVPGDTPGSPYRGSFPSVSCFANPDWSPDAATIIFSLFEPDAEQRWRGRLHVVSSGGGAPHLLIPEVVAPANPAYSDHDPAWSRR